MPESKAPTAPAIYVAGPLSGIKNVEGGFAINQRKANAVKAVLIANELCKLGYTPHVPHAYAWMRDEALSEHPDSDEIGQQLWDIILTLDEEMILRMDIVYRIEGKSAGTDREVAFANANGIPVIYSLEEAVKFCAAWKEGNAADFCDDGWNVSGEGMKVRFCNSFELLAAGISKTNKEKGFHDIHKERALEALRQSFFGTPFEPSDADMEKPVDISSVNVTLHRGDIDELFKQAVERLENAEIIGDPAVYLALQASEIFESIEALRKNPGNWNDKDGVWEELADTFIRIADFVGRYGPRFGITAYGFAEKIFEKWEINKGRPPRHGKRF